MYGYIYITTNIINNKRYIGKHKSEIFTEDYKGSGKLLWKSINKYGWNNFKVELLEECNSLKELNDREKYWIDYYNAVESDMFYNLRKGGDGGDIFVSMTDNEYNEFVKKVSENMLGDRNPFYGRKHSEESKRKMSESHKLNPIIPWNKGIKMSNELRERISKTLIERGTNSGENHPMYGKHHSEETKRKISETKIKQNRRGENSPMFGKTISEETKRKISDSLSGENNVNYGKRYVNNGIENKMVNPDELEYYLSNGWVLGCLMKRKRRLKPKDEVSANRSKIMKGRKWMNNGKKNIMINPDQFDEYINKGYKFGMLKIYD